MAVRRPRTSRGRPAAFALGDSSRTHRLRLQDLDPRLARGSSGDPSLSWLTVYALGNSVWPAYGISIESTPLIAIEAVAVVTSPRP
jgi:hypothetical protein